ncbi:MAG: preprotein translocase subunit SecG [Gammaproteobacteria bacterium]|nr:preprotein translocase subunit SecG [Gammaproteobacteria bacterium]
MEGILELVLLILLVVVCITLGALVLIQQGRGSDIGAAFGSGAANTIFGSTGATPFLVKFTAMLAIGFFVVTFGLAYTAKQKSDDRQNYELGDLPQTNEESQDDLLIPSDEDLLFPDESNSTSSPEGDLLPTDDSDNQGDILEQLLQEDSENDTSPPPEDDSEEGDTLPDL